jgi:hypothetical protein
MSKATMHNSEASSEVHELKDQLSEEKLQKACGGSTFKHSDLNFMHLSSPFGGGTGSSLGQVAMRGAKSGASGAV